MNIQNKYPKLRHIDFLLIDIASLIISFTAVFPLKFGGLWFISGDDWSNIVWARLVLLFVLADVILTFILDPYSGIFQRKYYMEIIKALQLTALNAISVSLVLYVFKIGEDYSRTVFILTYVGYFFLSLLLKYIRKALAASGKKKARSHKNVSLFVVAEKSAVDSVLMNVSGGDYSPYEIKGVHFTDETGSDDYNGICVYGDDYASQIIKNNISDVLIAVPPCRIKQEDYKKLTDNAVNIHLSVENIIGEQTEEQYVSDLGVLKTLTITSFSFSPRQLFYLIIKRILDLISGLIGLVLLIPTAAVIKIAYLIEGDRSRIFYTQKRVGQNGKIIKIFKFRTMVVGADEMLDTLLKDEKYRAQWEASQKLTDDPRVTKTGRFLRKSSIDELPQVINLIRADMSLVGPRPLLEGELEAHGGLQLYQRVKPGITGWWACNGRSNTDYRERLELEYYYIKHFSIYLDALCVLRTVLAVLKKDGAK